jgi:co-chaperonin GroES (HSP10)
MRAIGRNIVIDIIEETIKTDSGILLSADDAKGMRYGKGVIVTAGTDVVNIKEGDIIYYDKRNSFGMVIEGEQRTIINESNVVVVV